MELKSKRESAESPDVSPPLVYCALLRCESSINAKKGRATHLDGSYNIHHNTIVSAFPSASLYSCAQRYSPLSFSPNDWMVVQSFPTGFSLAFILL